MGIKRTAGSHPTQRVSGGLPLTPVNSQNSQRSPTKTACQAFGLVCRCASQGWLPAVRFIPCEAQRQTRPVQVTTVCNQRTGHFIALWAKGTGTFSLANSTASKNVSMKRSLSLFCDTVHIPSVQVFQDTADNTVGKPKRSRQDIALTPCSGPVRAFFRNY